MQFILTQEEYAALSNRAEARDKRMDKKFQALCSKIANEMPVKWEGWADTQEKKPWGCYLTMKEEWYCDNCPVQEICPARKTYSQ